MTKILGFFGCASRLVEESINANALTAIERGHVSRTPDIVGFIVKCLLDRFGFGWREKSVLKHHPLDMRIIRPEPPEENVCVSACCGRRPAEIAALRRLCRTSLAELHGS